MYADPSLIRDKTVKLRLNEEEHAFAKADAAALGMEFHDYLRMLVVEGALFELGDDAVMPLVH